MNVRTPQKQVINAIVAERNRQDYKWGAPGWKDRDWNKWVTILTEEVGEFAKAVLERDESAVREELEQIAAVAVSALEFGAEFEQPGR